MDCSKPGLPVCHQLQEFTQTYVHWVRDAIQPSHSLLSPSPPTFNPSQYQGLFQWVSSSHQVAQVLKSQIQYQSFQWIFRTDIFRIDWFDLLKLQGTLNSLLQYHSSKASILHHSAFFMFQLSHPCMTTGKTIALPLSIVAAVVKNSFANAGDIRDAGWIPGSGRLPRGRHANQLHYSWLENSMDRGAWRASAHIVAESDTTEAT